MEWKVFLDRGFCALGKSVSAYVDFDATPSGAIRCVGPFAPSNIDFAEIRFAMRSLTLLLERAFLDQDQYVLWGGYCDYPLYSEHRIDLQGTECGYIPAAWLRSQILGFEGPEVHREWAVTDKGVVHRSGIQFPDTNRSIVDAMSFHPRNVEESVCKLREQSIQIGSSILTGPHISAMELPYIDWTLPSRKQVSR